MLLSVFLDDLSGGLVGYGQIDSNGNINNAQLSPAAYEFLTTNGYLSSADAIKIATVSVVVPGLGEFVIAITVVYITIQAARALHP